MNIQKEGSICPICKQGTTERFITTDPTGHKVIGLECNNDKCKEVYWVIELKR